MYTCILVYYGTKYYYYCIVMILHLKKRMQLYEHYHSIEQHFASCEKRYYACLRVTKCHARVKAGVEARSSLSFPHTSETDVCRVGASHCQRKLLPLCGHGPSVWRPSQAEHAWHDQPSTHYQNTLTRDRNKRVLPINNRHSLLTFCHINQKVINDQLAIGVLNDNGVN